MNAIVLLIVAAVGALVAGRQRRRARLPARAEIMSPRNSTLIAEDGAVRSVQAAVLTVSEPDLERLWNATNLENLARTYWSFLQRVTLGLIRVHYGPDERRVMLLVKPLTLLRFEAPQYLLEPDHGNVSWQIRDGLLVARTARVSGFLAIDVRRMPTDPALADAAQLRIEVEVANFHPSIASRFKTPVYKATQSVVHVLVTHAFLRSLATLHLEESQVGQLAPADDVEAPQP